ncbi:DUF3618 domain-containing protein [Mycobacterium angelicum]|uniref:DUF3618 domain-containing protein n=1 Tax=Mycobacterium angelicum TaxID=470074 RepID=A0A1W9ZNU8_MYCAN|nr:DUF3618 domain-containing protein [Mycobacterium angelicum]MCV7199528.1 DUF3618 domain-containing protein [Mycobacterium angelicum]ORA19532.1 hypothetical protein BST12_17055 [Mycobacterium angelicum]
MTGAERTPPPAEPGPDASIDDIQADIRHTRDQLGATVEALSEKVSDKVDVVEKARVKARAAAPSLAIAASLAAVSVIALVWWRRRGRPG